MFGHCLIKNWLHPVGPNNVYWQGWSGPTVMKKGCNTKWAVPVAACPSCVRAFDEGEVRPAAFSWCVKILVLFVLYSRWMLTIAFWLGSFCVHPVVEDGKPITPHSSFHVTKSQEECFVRLGSPELVLDCTKEILESMFWWFLVPCICMLYTREVISWWSGFSWGWRRKSGW